MAKSRRAPLPLLLPLLRARSSRVITAITNKSGGRKAEARERAHDGVGVAHARRCREVVYERAPAVEAARGEGGGRQPQAGELRDERGQEDVGGAGVGECGDEGVGRGAVIITKHERAEATTATTIIRLSSSDAADVREHRVNSAGAKDWED